MSDWPIGLSTGCFYQQSIFDCLEPICSAGFNQVEVCSFPAHLDYHNAAKVAAAAQRFEALGIEAYSFHAPFADHIDITAPDLSLRLSSMKEVFAAVEAAALLGVRYFVIHPGPEQSIRPHGDERAWRLENVAKSLSDVAVRCRELGMMCVLENKLPHLLFGNICDMLWILGAMSTTHVGVCLDTGHAHLGGDLYSMIHKLGGHLKMIHASDNSGGGDDHLPPGEGHIEWPRLLAQLAAHHFNGSLILELAGRIEKTRLFDAARLSRRMLRRESWRQASCALPR